MRTIDVRDLLRRPGSSKEVRVREVVRELGLELAIVPEDAPIEADLLLESVVEGILISGTLGGRMTLRCARCLVEFEDDFSVAVADELFTRDALPGEEEYPLPEAGDLDPEPMVRDAVLLAMPFSPLCRPDCLGLCERCGGDRNLGECGCAEPVDPRWSALEGLFETQTETRGD